MRLFAVLAILFLMTTPVQAQDIRVHLLGTGGPELSHRAGYATLVEAGDQLLLFDAGREVVQRAYQARINPKRITRVFLTHLHNDHYEGLPNLWMTPWFLLGRSEPIALYGPPGTAEMVSGMRAMYAHDLTARVNPFNPLSALDVPVTIVAPGVVHDRGGVRVTAFQVSHADGDPSFGYRIDYKGRSVVLSGDTARDARLIAAAAGADLLVHNVIAMSPRLSALPEMQGVLAKLTTPEEAAIVFNAAKPRLAVYSHIVKKELSGAAGDAVILERTRAAGYAGPLVMGDDRMVIEVGETIRVIPPADLTGLPDLDTKTADF